MFSNKLISDVLVFIDDNINQKIDISYLANHFYINRYYLMKLFKKELDITINNYINYLKIYNSLNFLKQNNSILKTALCSGYNSQEYYSEIFKKIIGVKPLTYKKFINYKYINDSDRNIILSSLINLQDLINKKDKYINNVKLEIRLSLKIK